MRKKFNNCRVQEMNEREMKSLNGGGLWFAFIAGAILGGMIYDVVNNSSDVGAALSKGYADGFGR